MIPASFVFLFFVCVWILTSYIYYILYIIYSYLCLMKFNPFTWDDHSTIIWWNLWLTPTNRAVSSCFRPECVVLLPVEINLKHIGRRWCFFDCYKGSRSGGAGGSLSLTLQWMFADLTVLESSLWSFTWLYWIHFVDSIQYWCLVQKSQTTTLNV